MYHGPAVEAPNVLVDPPLSAIQAGPRPALRGLRSPLRSPLSTEHGPEWTRLLAGRLGWLDGGVPIFFARRGRARNTGERT